MTMASLGFIGPPPNLIFYYGPPNYFGLKFLGHPPKIRGLLPCYVIENYGARTLIAYQKENIQFSFEEQKHCYQKQRTLVFTKKQRM